MDVLGNFPPMPKSLLIAESKRELTFRHHAPQIFLSLSVFPIIAWHRQNITILTRP